MMKHFAGIFLMGLVFINPVMSKDFKAPDIVIDSKLDYDWSGILITKFRTLLKNVNMSDPFRNKFTQPIVITDSVEGYLPQDSKDLINDFGNAVGLKVLQAETKVSLHGFAYDVKGFKTNLKASEPLTDGLLVASDFSASQVTLTADKISFSLVIPGKHNLPVLEVDIIRPVIKASEEHLIKFFTQIKIQDHKDFYKLHIHKANFDDMAKSLLQNPERVELNYDQIIIPDVCLKVGNKTIVVSKEKVQNLISVNREAIKGILLAQVASSLKTNTTQVAFKVLEQYKLSKEYWLNSDIMKSQFQIGNFSSNNNGDNLQINLPGDFCTAERFKVLQKKCVTNKITKTSLTRLNQALHAKSVSGMKKLMIDGDANFVASISEDYLNKLLVTTYDAGMWKESLDEIGVSLGPNKVVMRLDQPGDAGTLIMDVIYRPTPLEKFMTGSKEIRFPLAMNISVRFENVDGSAAVIVRLNDVDTTDQTLIYGRPAENMISTVQDVPRFKSKIASAIRGRLVPMRNKNIIDLRFSELDGLGLERVNFISDGNGRMNAILRLEDVIMDESSGT